MTWDICPDCLHHMNCHYTADNPLFRVCILCHKTCEPNGMTKEKAIAKETRRLLNLQLTGELIK